jgi:hypothetical protein
MEEADTPDGGMELRARPGQKATPATGCGQAWPLVGWAVCVAPSGR